MPIDAEYARISRDKRGAAEGVETQQAENADAADELGLTIGASYVDNDLSAYTGWSARSTSDCWPTSRLTRSAP